MSGQNGVEKERNLMNSIEKLGNKINELGGLIGWSLKILQQLERTETSGLLLVSDSESKPIAKPDIIGIIENFSDRIDQITNTTEKNLKQLSRMIGD